MEWHVGFDEDHDTVVAEMSGLITVEQADGMLRTVRELGATRGARRFFLDGADATLGFTGPEMITRERAYADIGFAPDARFALLIPSWSPDWVLIEAVLAKRYVVRAFVERGEALEWLRRPW